MLLVLNSMAVDAKLVFCMWSKMMLYTCYAVHVALFFPWEATKNYHQHYHYTTVLVRHD